MESALLKDSSHSCAEAWACKASTCEIDVDIMLALENSRCAGARVHKASTCDIDIDIMHPLENSRCARARTCKASTCEGHVTHALRKCSCACKSVIAHPPPVPSLPVPRLPTPLPPPPLAPLLTVWNQPSASSLWYVWEPKKSRWACGSSGKGAKMC